MSSRGRRVGPGRRSALIAALLAALSGPPSLRAEAEEAVTADSGADQQGVVAYPAEFFSRYQPNTALDMVQQIPGFQVDNGGGQRGFGASVGNILIDDRRLSAKQDSPSSILDRIPASHVERIELIRRQVRSIDLLGQPMVANVVLRGDVPAAVRWDMSVLYNFLRPAFELTDQTLDVSRSDRWGGVDYVAGMTLARRDTGDDIDVRILDGSESPIESRTELQDEIAYNANGNLILSTTVGRTLLQLNSRLAWQDFDTVVVSDRTPLVGTGEFREVTFGRYNGSKAIELGLDAERSLAADVIGKAILLHTRNDSDTLNTQRVVEETAGQTLLRLADSNVLTTETIARLEFEWANWRAHAVKLNVEGALNVIDGTLAQTDDTGTGPVPVEVPGGNTRVEELRGDVLLKDTWSLGDWVLDYGLGAEVSEISQSGDAVNKRRFSFLKPQGLVIRTPRRGVQTRLRVAREVAQLNLNDFVTTTQFRDENLLLGGQDLVPQNTWVAELTHERRFGDLGVVALTGYHHWISDVQDFVPLTDATDAPSNIGDGRRWGVVLESTVSLDALHLTGARLDMKARWQDSTVIDPVNGQRRKLTGRSESQGPPNFAFTADNNYDFMYDVAFRQDLEAARVAWGWDIADRGERTWFKVNELNRYNEAGIEMNAFIETTRWFGVKIRLEGSNLDHFTETRNRELYEGRRGLSPVSRRELTDTVEGRRLILTVSGSF